MYGKHAAGQGEKNPDDGLQLYEAFDMINRGICYYG